MRPGALLDATDRLRLDAAIREVERATSGELVVCVVRACDEYGAAGWRLAAALAALALLGLAGLREGVSAASLLAAQVVAALLAHLVARIDAVRRLLIDEALVEARVRERALRAFAEHGLARTAGRTGVLILVATFERRVAVLADEGVHRALAPGETWDDVVALAVAGLRSGRAAEGLLAAIRRCGEVLSRCLPPGPTNPDEIVRAVIVEE
ncbi:MAG TPA: TPM domain-containing protein [Myxococcota bacterium]|nr:TPM domain-containing protein [Myxococcota bacterium]